MHLLLPPGLGRAAGHRGLQAYGAPNSASKMAMSLLRDKRSRDNL